MWPIIIQIPFPVYTYSVMLSLAFLLGYILLLKEIRRREFDVGIAESTALIAVLAGVFGSRFFYLLTQQEAWRAVHLWSLQGLSVTGGFLLVALFLLVLWRIRKVPLGGMLDALAPVLTLGFAIVFIGSFLSGNGNYGLPCVPGDLDFSLCRPYPEAIIPAGEAVRPVSLYLGFIYLVLFVLLWGLRIKIRRSGMLFGIFAILSGGLFIISEVLRQSAITLSRFIHFSDVMMLAGILLLTGIVAIVLAMVMGKKTDGDKPKTPKDEPPKEEPEDDWKPTTVAVEEDPSARIRRRLMLD